MEESGSKLCCYDQFCELSGILAGLAGEDGMRKTCKPQGQRSLIPDVSARSLTPATYQAHPDRMGTLPHPLNPKSECGSRGLAKCVSMGSDPKDEPG